VKRKSAKRAAADASERSAKRRRHDDDDEPATQGDEIAPTAVNTNAVRLLTADDLPSRKTRRSHKRGGARVRRAVVTPRRARAVPKRASE
jgi:hypothetical protein